MTREYPLPRKSRRFRRFFILLLVLFVGVSFPMGAYWLMDKTERRIRAAERMLMEELAVLRAEIATLSQKQQASQEAVEQLAMRTEALMDLWQAQLDRPSPSGVRGTGEGMLSTAQSLQPVAGEAVPADGRSEAGKDVPAEEGDVPFWAAWWTGVAYYAMKAAPVLYQLARLHPAIP